MSRTRETVNSSIDHRIMLSILLRLDCNRVLVLISITIHIFIIYLAFIIVVLGQAGTSNFFAYVINWYNVRWPEKKASVESQDKFNK